MTTRFTPGVQLALLVGLMLNAAAIIVKFGMSITSLVLIAIVSAFVVRLVLVTAAKKGRRRA